MLYILKITEAYGIYSDTYKKDILLDVTDTKLNTNEKVANALQKAYNEYYRTLDYKTENDALDDGVCFGSMFSSIPPEITKKHGFQIVEPIEINADYDNGFLEK